MTSELSAESPTELVSMRDIDVGKNLSMNNLMSDACPLCGGFCMQSGDYICWGACYRCVEECNKEEGEK